MLCVFERALFILKGGQQLPPTRSHPNLNEFGYTPKNGGIDELVRLPTAARHISPLAGGAPTANRNLAIERPRFFEIYKERNLR